MKQLKGFLKSNFPFVSIFLIWLALVLTNFKPNTWLLGWDSLMPEFNFALNIKRSLLGTWQEYQGLGITGGMAHNADLSRQLILFLWSFIMPDNWLRYGWHFLMLLIGPIGAIFLTQNILKLPKSSKNTSSLIAGVFYLLNLATLQYFFVPYEAFSSFYGFLPWLILGLIKILEHFTPKNKIKLFVLLLLASSAFYVQTLFVVFAIVATFFLIDFVLQKRKIGLVHRDFKTLLTAGLIFLVSTSFWLIPVSYFTLTSASNTVESKQNQVATIESQLMNKGFGNILNIFQLKGYWFEYTDLDIATGQTTYLLQSWRDFSNNPFISVTYILVTLFGIIGLIYFVIRSKNKWRVALGLTTVFTFMMLTSGQGLVGMPFRIITEAVPLFGQIFRTSFTKWSIVLALLISIGLAQFLFLLSQKIKDRPVNIIVAGGLALMIVISMLPAFKSNFIYDGVRVKLPDSYFKLFEYSNNQIESHARIMNLPINSMWGWNFNNWNYRGSGFLWYGIENPIVDRNFDVWSPENEKLYFEFSHAIKADDYQTINRLIEKYDVSYFLLDESIVSADSENTTKIINESRKLLENLNVYLVWSDQQLKLYKINRFIKTAGVLNYVQKIPNLNNDSGRSNSYAQEFKNGNFVRSDSNFTNQYPFSSMPTLIEQKLEEIGLSQGIKEINISYENDNLEDNLSFLKTYGRDKYSGPVNIEYLNDRLIFRFETPMEISLGDKIITLPFPNTINKELSYVDDFPERLTLSIGEEIFEINKGGKAQTWLSNIGNRSIIEFAYFDTTKSSLENIDIVVAPEDYKKDSILIEFPHDLSVNLPVNQNLSNQVNVKFPVNVSDLEVASVLKSAKGCDPFGRGNIKINPDEQKITVTDYGSVCISSLISGSNSTTNGFLLIEGHANNETFPKTFVDNKDTGVVFAENILKPSKKQIGDALLLNAMENQPQSPKVFNLTLKSSGGETAELILDKVLHVEIPFSLSEVSSMLMGDNTDGQTQIPSSITKWGTGIYQVGFDKETKGIFLNQSFDPAWIAVSNNNFEIVSHQKLNDWANFWQIKTNDVADNTLITLIYIPQLIVLFGFVSILTLSAILVFDYKLNQKFVAKKGFTTLRLRLGIRRMFR